MSRSNPPCAACKFLRRKCPSDCIFAPYFPPDQPARFLSVHNVYGASNVSKFLKYVPEANREETARTLIFEAAERLQDPVHGCYRRIYALGGRLRQIRSNCRAARKELAKYIGPAAYISFVEQSLQQKHGLGGGQPQSHVNVPQGALSSLMPPPSGAPGPGVGMCTGLTSSASSMPQGLMIMGDRQQVHHQRQQVPKQAERLTRMQQRRQQQYSMLEQYAEILMSNQRLCPPQPTGEDEQLGLALDMSTDLLVRRRPPPIIDVEAELQQHGHGRQLELLNRGFPISVPGQDQMAFGGATIAVNAEQQRQQQRQEQEQHLINLGLPDSGGGYDQMAPDGFTTAVATEQQQQQEQDPMAFGGATSAMASMQKQQQEQKLFNLGLLNSVRGYDQMAFGGSTIPAAAQPTSVQLPLFPTQQNQALLHNDQQHQNIEAEQVQQDEQQQQQHTEPHNIDRIRNDDGKSTMDPPPSRT